jgi:hypothetical protein
MSIKRMSPNIAMGTAVMTNFQNKLAIGRCSPYQLVLQERNGRKGERDAERVA